MENTSLSVQIMILFILANNVDPDQRALEEAL